MEEMKVREYGWWSSYTYKKQNNETFCNCFKWGREGPRGRHKGGNVNNVQNKSTQNCCYEYPLYNEYILIKIYKRKLGMDWRHG
jgi:hypothetical protein